MVRWLPFLWPAVTLLVVDDPEYLGLCYYKTYGGCRRHIACCIRPSEQAPHTRRPWSTFL
jgi:hypothetical protein